MDFEIGTELLVETPSNVWAPAVVEEDDGDEIFIAYIEGNTANEWINKDSLRIKPKNDELMNTLTTTSNQSSRIIPPEIKSFITKRASCVHPTEKEKKSTSGNRLSTIFKVKFKKDDFLSKKSQDSKHKEHKSIKDSKKSSDCETKPPLLHNFPDSEKNSTNIPLQQPNIKENTEVELKTTADITNSLKDLQNSYESSLLRSENFEESLEDIEAEAEICSPTKAISQNDSKKKKKKKKYFIGVRRRSEKKRKKKPRQSTSSKTKILEDQVVIPKLQLEDASATLQKHLNTVDNSETPPTKKMKLSFLANSSGDNSLNQNSPFPLANNTLLQNIRMNSTDEQGFRCPKQECHKLFRKENLLMMHIKHYHEEYTELLVSTPNVTDLATARIEGENVDELSPSYFLHRISQLEAKRSIERNTYCSPLSFNTISSSVNYDPEPENNTIQSENDNSNFISSDQKTNITQSYDSKDSGYSGVVESVDSVQETPVKITTQIKEPIKKITIVDDFENEARDCYDSINAPSSGRHFKIKKNKSNIESLPKNEVINCSCGSNQEDGLMIQCDICLCWQHGFCNKIDSEDQVPVNYICTSCLNPSKKRQSKQYDFLQDWIKEGIVPSVLQHKDERRRKDENILKQSHQLVAEMIEHKNYLYSLLVKTAIYGQSPDHPKLYLWSEQSSKINEDPAPNKLEELLMGPIPEKPINTAECRKNLLDEIEDGYNNLEARINVFEAKTNELEDQVNGTIDNEVLTNTINMLLRDLNSIRHHLSFENKDKEPNDML